MMSRGLNFTPQEEKEFEELTALHPKGYGQKMSVWFDRVANNIWMFFFLLIFSCVGFFVSSDVMAKMLYYSNTYQLVALPLLGVATGLSTLVILRFLFRILLEIRKEFKEIKQMHKELHTFLKEFKRDGV